MTIPGTEFSTYDVLLPSLFERTPIGVAFLDADGRYIDVNQAYADMNGRSRDEHRGRRLEDVLPTLASRIASAIDQALATGRPVDIEFSGRRHPGQAEDRHWVGIYIPVRTPDGRPAVGAMIRDVTDRKRAELQRSAALDREQLSRHQAERQRDFLRLVLENAPMAIAVVEGPEYRLSLINKFALDIVNTPADALLGRPVAEMFPQAFEPVREAWRRVYQEGITVTIPEREALLPDGRRMWTYACYAPVRQADGSPLGIMSLSLDITALKRIQAVVAAQKHVLELIAEGESLPDILRAVTTLIAEHSPGAIPSILLTDRDGRHLRHGAAPGLPAAYTQAIDGLEIGPAAGSCGTAAYRRERVVVVDTLTDPLWASFRELALTHDLRACWSTPINGATGRLLGTFAIYYNESREPSAEEIRVVDLMVRTTALAIEWCQADEERRRLLEAERQARQDAEAASRSKDEFVATLSHELRTPLNAILGWTRMMRAGRVDEASRVRALEAIERNTRAQSQLVEDLLDISRIVTGKLRLDVRSVELSSVLESALDAIRPAAEAKNIRLHKVLDPRAAPIAGDPDRLQQVVWNLLSNAIKFTPKGGRVQIRLERINSHVEIIVSDTGMGIAPELVPHVFERFRQGDRGSTKATGLGLGLAIARHLIELHGGTIHAASEGAGRGATFTIKLPLVVAHAERRPGEVHPRADDGLVTATLPPLPPLRILVVEDDPDGRELMAHILGSAGATVKTAASAAEGFATALEWRPDLLISDIEMPEEDGYSFVKRLRQEPGFSPRELPAIALTAYARVEDRIRALAAGFQMHVPKPVEPAELIAVSSALAPPQRT